MAKLYTTLYSFNNSLNFMNYLFSLVVWEHLSPVQFETRVFRKLCDKSKILKNMLKVGLFKSNISVICGGTSLKSGLLGGSPMRLVTSAFSN